MDPLRLGGWLLIAGALLALAGASTPPYKQWYSPLPEALRVIAAHPISWRVINGGFLAGTAIAAMGLGVVAFALRDRLGGPIALASALAFAAGTLFWILNLIYRVTVVSWAAEQFVSTGSIPPIFFPLQAQAGVYFGLFALFGFAGLAASGWSVFMSSIAPRSVGWVLVIVGIVGAPVVVFIGPWMLYVPLLLLGLALVRG